MPSAVSPEFAPNRHITMTRILVTGAAGFIGYHVARELISRDFEVTGVDDFNPYYLPELKRSRIELLLPEKGFNLIEADISRKEAVDRCFEEGRPSMVCHLAAQAGVRYSLINPYAYQSSNLHGFLNIIEASRLYQVERLVYASSSSVYGGNTKMPYSESDPVNTPVSLYAATKRANELMAHSYSHLWNMQTIGLRYFTVYGEWGRPDMAYWSFLENMRRQRPIKVFNYGRNKRDFTYIDDVIQGTVAALLSDGLKRYEIINLGNNRPVELMDFIGTLERISGIEAIKEMVAPQPGDVDATYADIALAKEKLGFEPSTDLERGLERFVKWLMDNQDLAERVRKHRVSARDV